MVDGSLLVPFVRLERNLMARRRGAKQARVIRPCPRTSAFLSLGGGEAAASLAKAGSNGSWEPSSTLLGGFLVEIPANSSPQNSLYIRGSFNFPYILITLFLHDINHI